MIAKIIDSRTIHVYDKSQFDWYAIRNSGQIFRDPPCNIVEEIDKIIISATGDKQSDWLWNFFDLDTDYGAIKGELSRFCSLRQSIRVGSGIRILKQPFAEIVISFIISANNNIKRFTKTIAQIDFDNLGQYSEEDFRRMGCGYRSPYLVKAVRQLAEMNGEELGKLNNAELRKSLMSISGVGPKVADCVMLFAEPFHRLDVAPVDTWIAKAVSQLGSDDADAIFGHRFAGVAQQYIFYNLQHLRGEVGSSV
jgi:N-glycosylase/DNA lyase